MDDNNPTKKTSQWRFGTIFGSLLLIALGLLLLLDTLGLLGRSVWEIIWKLWPLLFIALGLDALFRKNQIFGSVFWIGLGGVFLLTSFDILGRDAWNALFNIWPLLLVTAGFEILLGKRSLWLSLIVTIVVLGILAVALGLTGINPPLQHNVDTNIKEPLGKSERANIFLAMGVGDLNLFSLKDSKELIAGQISTDGAHVRSQTTMQGKTVIYSLEHNNPAMVPFENSWQWKLGLTPLIPMNLESLVGVGSMGLILDDIMLESLNIRQGVGEIEAVLPGGYYQVGISQAAGQLILEIPADIPIRLEINQAISGLSIPSDFESHNDYYYTPGTLGTNDFIMIEINQAVGSIILRYKK